MHALLSLANTESHNFTAEVLLREAADQWDLSQASVSAMQWMRAQNLPTAGLRVADGSGLSRGNRVTSRTLAALLLRMNQHPLSAYYRSSMAIAGQRGTLRNYFRGSSLEGRFHGKTGTLHRRAFCFGNPSDQRWAPICEHDFQRSTRSKCNDRAGASFSPTAQPVPFIDLRQDAARRAREIGTASEPPRSLD